MTPTTLTYHPSQSLLMRTSNPHRIIPSGAQPPRSSLPPVKLFPPIHPIQQRRPQPIRRRRVLTQSRTVACPRNLNTNSSPAPSEMGARRMRQFGPVSVQSEDLNDARDRVRGRSMRWESHVNRNGGALTFDPVRMRHLDLAKLARKQLRAFHVRGFVEGPCFLLLRGARDREASNAVQGGCSQVER